MHSLFQSSSGSEGEWISISDLMAGLMMIFLFIAISFMNSVQIRAKQIKQIAVAYQELQDALYEDLRSEFEDDLPRWNAKLYRETLSVRFEEPEVLFAQGSANVTPRFREILNDFFPRYVRIMYSDKYRDSIEEIRIEGHTSSEWSREVSAQEAYFLNMQLSQGRTRSVLEVCLSLAQDQEVGAWSRRFITANGLSSSRPIAAANGEEERAKSRRVEFRTKTAAEKKVVEIIREVEASP